ncbi:hypothetical protein O0L34_g7791 [Tuta absoluta]|nr:hypothetical protein O0L34_g7791 [Tuta absoluta]
MTKTFRNDILTTTHKGKHHVINDNQSNIRAKDKYKIKSRDEGHNIEKEHNHDQEELSQSRNVRTHQENHKTQKGRGHSQQVAKQDKHKKSEEIDKNILREKPKIHKSTSYSRVTQGFKYNKKVVNANKIRDKQKSQSYESVEMIDSSDSDLQNNEKAATQIHRSTIGKRSRLKTAQIETEVLKPFSIARQLDYLREKLSDYATIEQEVIGKTVEYNDIVLWKIKERPEDSQTASAFFRSSKKKIKYADEPPEKKIILIVHGLSVMGWHNLDCLNKIKRFETLLGYYMENLDCYDIYLIPMANPDGVAKALGTQPWNKNVSPQNACPGVHLDRNFDVEWNKNASKESSCRASYPGPAPFSEKETKAIRELFKNLSHKMVAYIHVHAGSHDSTVFKGDAVLYPKGYSDDSSDDDRYIDLKGDIEEAMRNTSLNVVSVTVDTLYNWYGLTTGASVDYASKVYGIPYTMELVMQLYEDDTQVANEDMREQNAALTEIWQVVIDVILDSIYRRVIKPDEQ